MSAVPAVKRYVQCQSPTYKATDITPQAFKMAPTDAVDHDDDSSNESIECSSAIDLPYTNEELAKLVKVLIFAISIFTF